MPAYNFQARFAPLVRAGLKKTTIRGRAAKVGSTAYLFTGQRTRACVRLGQATITVVLPIEIGRHASGEPYAELDGGKLVHGDLDALAKVDGFETGEEMVAWFSAQYGLLYHGYLIGWNDILIPQVAWCWASGLIEVGDTVPEGAIKIAEGQSCDLKYQIDAVSRHCKGGLCLVRLVPGIPEAETQEAKADALAAWLDWCSKGNGKKHRKGVVFMTGQDRSTFLEQPPELMGPQRITRFQRWCATGCRGNL